MSALPSVTANSMEGWKTELSSEGVRQGEVKIRRGIFQGDSISPLLSVMSMIPLTLVLRKVKEGYDLGLRRYRGHQPLIIYG